LGEERKDNLKTGSLTLEGLKEGEKVTIANLLGTQIGAWENSGLL